LADKTTGGGQWATASLMTAGTGLLIGPAFAALEEAKIESLLRILDSAEVPETLPSQKPQMIPIKNTKASRIEILVREVFRARMGYSSGGSGSSCTSARTCPIRPLW